jgi:hypothetical protein
LTISKDVNETALLNLTIYRPKTVEVFSYPMLPNYRKRIAFWKVPRLRPFVFLVRAVCQLKWAWIVGGVVLVGELKCGEKPVPLLHCAAHISLGLIWDRTLALAVRSSPLFV